MKSSADGNPSSSSLTSQGKGHVQQQQQQQQEESSRNQSPSVADVTHRPEEAFVSIASPNVPRRSWSPTSSEKKPRGKTTRASISSTIPESSRLGQLMEGSTEMGAPLPDRFQAPQAPMKPDFRITPLKKIRKQWQDKEITQNETPPAFKNYSGGKKGYTEQQPSDFGNTLDRRGRITPPPDKKSSGLPVKLLALNDETEDTSDVRTYHNHLAKISQGQSPDKAQRVLNVLATMSRNGVVPNEETWAFVERCSDISHPDTGPNKSGEELSQLQPIKLSLYTADGQSEGLPTAVPTEDGLASGAKQQKKSTWKMEQDLSLLPPAFRSSLLAMLRIREEKEGRPTVSKEETSSQQKGIESFSVHSDTDGSGEKDPAEKRNISKRGPTVVDRLDQQPREMIISPRAKKSIWRPPQQKQVSTEFGNTESASTLGVQRVPLDDSSISSILDPGQTSITRSGVSKITLSEKSNANEIARHPTTTIESGRPESILLSPGPRLKNRWAPPKVKEEIPVDSGSDNVVQNIKQTPGDPLHELYMKHGIQRYMRPDGFGEAPLKKPWRKKEGNSSESNTPQPPPIILQEALDLDKNNRSLLSIAESDFPDKAKQAGNVLKNMKANLIKPDEITRILLEKCSGFERPEETKRVIPTPPLDEADYTTPTNIVRKRVTFSDTLVQTRIIRRRRSISATERWDDPLTPPKRTTTLMELAQGRFSAEPRDDRPSLPRRSDSMSSLLSGGSDHSILSDRSDRTSTSSSSDASIPDSPLDSPKALAVPTFKLPFEDSPKALPKGKQPDGGNPPKAPDRAATETPAEKARPPTSRPIVRRRLSISGTREYRDAPLTPPRRVSAPLDFLVAARRPQSPHILAPTGRRTSPSTPNPIPRQPSRQAFPLPKSPHPKKLSVAAEAKRPPLPNKIPVPKQVSDQPMEHVLVQADSHGKVPLVKHGSDHGPPRAKQRDVPQMSSSSHDTPRRISDTTEKGEKQYPYTNLLDRHEHLVAEAWSVVDLPEKSSGKDGKRGESSFSRLKIKSNTTTPRRASISAFSQKAPIRDGRPGESTSASQRLDPTMEATVRRAPRRASIGTTPTEESSVSSELASVKLKSTAAGAAMKKGVSLARQSSLPKSLTLGTAVENTATTKKVPEGDI